MTPETARRSLTALRLALGATAYATPDLAARIFGIDPDESPALPASVRLFGARETALGIAIMGPRTDALERWLALGVVVDALDVITVGIGTRQRNLGIQTVVVGGGLASIAVALGVKALRDRQP